MPKSPKSLKHLNKIKQTHQTHCNTLTKSSKQTKSIDCVKVFLFVNVLPGVFLISHVFMLLVKSSGARTFRQQNKENSCFTKTKKSTLTSRTP